MIRFSDAAPAALLVTALTAALCAPPLSAQTYSHGIDLAGLGNGGPGKSFGIAYEPTQDRIYVAVCGDFVTPNDVVAVIDPATDLVVATIQAGLFPEDMAFDYDAAGNLRYGLVTNSTSGSVTVWDAALQPVATIALPDPFGFGTCYPYGIVVDAGTAWIGTQDGSGAIYAIDLATLSASPQATLSLPGLSFGRPLAVGGELWLPGVRYTPSFSGSGAGLARIVPGGAGDAWMVEYSDGLFEFPAGQDLVRLADGRCFLGGTWFGGRLHVVTPAGELARTLDVGGAGTQGLAADAAGTLLVSCDNVLDRLAFVDLVDEELESELLIGLWGSQPNDAIFAHDKLYVSCQGSEQVLVIDNLPVPTAGPAHGGSLTLSDSTPLPGDTVVIDLVGDPGQPLALLVSADLGGGSFQGLPLALGVGWDLRGSGVGSLQQSLTLPIASRFRGRRVYFQGVLEDPQGGSTTWPVSLVLQ